MKIDLAKTYRCKSGNTVCFDTHDQIDRPDDADYFAIGRLHTKTGVYMAHLRFKEDGECLNDRQYDLEHAVE
ncbi:MAG: hypothetical protein AAGJ87_13740 [Pseudomonadota bacterium]